MTVALASLMSVCIGLAAWYA